MGVSSWGVDWQPEGSWLPGQEGLWTQSWAGSHEGHVSQLDPWAQPRMWNASQCCPAQGLETSEGWDAGKGGAGPVAPAPRASKLPVSHALHLPSSSRAVPWDVLSPPSFEVRTVRLRAGKGLPKATQPFGVTSSLSVRGGDGRRSATRGRW